MHKILPPDEYYKTLPKKPIAAGVLFFDAHGHLLIVKPNYGEGWILPGGGVDANESPTAAAIREIKEELGLDVTDISLALVNYRADAKTGRESIHFVFNGRTLTQEQIKNISLQEEELDEFQFIDVSAATSPLRLTTQNRVRFALGAIQKKTIAYMES